MAAPVQVYGWNAEALLVGAALCNPDLLAHTSPLRAVKPEHFRDGHLAPIWQAMIEADPCDDAGEFVLIVADALASKPGEFHPCAFDDIGGPVALFDLIERTPWTRENIRHYARAVVLGDLAIEDARDLFRALRELARAA